MLTVTPRFSQALVQTAERLGLRGIRPPRGEARIDLDAQDALWQQICQASEDPLIGLQLALQLQVGHLDIAGLLLMSCETLGESLDLLLEYLPLIGQGGDARLQMGEQQVALIYTPHYQVCRPARVELVLACCLQLARWSTADRFEAAGLRFQHAPQDAPQRYRQLLGCPVAFGCEDNAVLMDRRQLQQCLIQANPQLRDQLRQLADADLHKLGRQSVSSRVSATLREHPQMSKEEVAASLAMSGRHLTRCLREEGFAFRQLRDRELEQKACAALGRGDKISAVAAQLGFSDERAFARAFRRWTGLAPSEFRGTEERRSPSSFRIRT